MRYYLDNAATSWPKPEAVYTKLDHVFRNLFSPKRGTDKASRLGAEHMQQARESLATLFNIKQASHICFTNGCTHALNIAIQAFPWNPGDAVVISAIEHHALSRPVRKMAREKGINFYIVPYTDENPFDLETYQTLLDSHANIRMVATTHASNVIGSILPVSQIGQMARKAGKTYLLDAAQSAGVLHIDVEEMCIDLLAVPGHKSLYGPPGIGALYVRDTVPLQPVMEGGTGNDSGKHVMGTTLPDSIEVGTIPLPQILAFAEGVRWVQDKTLTSIYTHEMDLLRFLLDGLCSIPKVTVYGHTDIMRKTPVVSFNIKGFTPEEAGERLSEEFGIALRTGFHCAPMAHEAIGTIHQGGTVRASLGYFTQQEDVKALIEAVQVLSSRL